MTLREKITLLPHSPGVYRYYDDTGTVIYVGKAKDLSKRVAQYFVAPQRLNTKTRLLVSKIADLQYSVVDSEADALLLENNLIKQYKPRYNILLKDSKTYPWICVSGEDFPRVFLTRRVERNGSRYFGPYSSVMHAKALLEFFHRTYPLRNCKLKITSKDILNGRKRPCLEFHLGKCRSCCTGRISKEEYNSYIEEIVRLLTSGVGDIVKEYTAAMTLASEELRFEDALLYKQRIDALQSHYSKSIITANTIRDLDVFAIIIEGGEAYGAFMRIRGGAVVRSLNLGFSLRIEEDRASVLSAFIAEIESKFGQIQPEALVPFLPDVEIEGVTFTVPSRGDKLELLQLCGRNAMELRANSIRSKEHTDPEQYRQEVLKALQEALGMSQLPVHIECFDNSNIQGTNPVASCVVFRDAAPSKKDYRKFKIKTVIGANDYASMKEVVNRRYSRMLAENPEDLPQLIVIDGGKGQLEFAYQAICELGIEKKVFVVGLAKRLEEVIRIGDPYPLFIDRNSQALKLLQKVRDEAHRFGITFHRSLRSKQAVHSVLRDIKGIGPATEQRLLMSFGSVASIAAASREDLAALVGESLADRIKERLLLYN